MSAWSNLIGRLDTNVIKLLGGVQVTFIPQDGSGSQVISGLETRPAMDEDFTPGGSIGTDVVRLFIQPQLITPAPRRGDVIIYNTVSYMVQETPSDLVGGAVLKLRAT